MKQRSILFSGLMIFMLLFIAACGSEPKEVAVPTPAMPVPAGEPVLTDVPVQETIVIPDTPETAETAPADVPVPVSSGEVKELTVTGSNFKWELSGPTVKKGDQVKLTIKVAEGGHGFALPGFNIRSQELGAGKEQIVEFVADQSGSFEYFCNVPCGSGHRQMKGTLVVED